MRNAELQTRNSVTSGHMNDPDVRPHLTYLRRLNARDATIQHRGSQLARLHNYLGTNLRDTTSEELDKWQMSLRVSPSSVFTYTSHVRGFYRWAFDTGRTETDLARDLVLPRLHRRHPRPIPETELRHALVSARFDHQLFCWFLLAGYCGLRAGEIAAVCRADFNPDDAGGAFLNVRGKGGHERVVRVSPDVFVELRGFLHLNGPLFRTQAGKPVTAHWVSVRSSQHLRGVGLNYTLHTLRHRFATRLCDIGADIRDVQAALGHQSLATTTQYVAHNARRGSAMIDRLGEGVSALHRRQH